MMTTEWEREQQGEGEVRSPEAADWDCEGEPTEAPRPAGGEGSGPAPERETILFVEDEPSVRTIARRVLEREGYTVLVAKHGGDALHIAKEYEGPIHLVITDVVMPVLSGRKLVDRLILDRPDLRVIFISGYPDETIVRHGELGADAVFVEKPFTPALIARKVREVLDSPSAGQQHNGGAEEQAGTAGRGRE